MIERKEIPNMDWFNQLFSNIYVIHVAGVAHNDLDCKNIVGTGAFLINFGLSKIINVDIDENTESFLISINTFFYNFLNFL
jgi:tRNA A-37 threonylcarbamoyl transferase component Bud32